MGKTRNQLITENISLVKKLAKIKLRKTLPSVRYEDLFSAGCMGLIEVVDKYDEKMGQFETYASSRIFGAMSDYINETMTWGRWMPEKSNMLFLEDFEPSYEVSYIDELFEHLVRKLSEEGKQILYWRYMEDFSLKEIGEKLGVGKSMISQKLKKILKCITK